MTPTRGVMRVFLEEAAFKWSLDSRWMWQVGLGAAEPPGGWRGWRREGHKQRCWWDEAKGWGICLGRKPCFARHIA